MERKNRAGRSIKPSIYQHLYVFLLAVIISSPTVFPSFINAPFVVWKTSETPVSKGRSEINLELTFTDPCAQDDVVNKFPTAFVKQALEHCESRKQSQFLSPLFELCPYTEDAKPISKREKREVFTLLILGASLIGGLATGGVALWNTKQNAKSIDALNKRVLEEEQAFKEMQAQIKNLFEFKDNMTASYNTVVKRFNQFYTSEMEINSKMMEMSYTISHLVNYFATAESVFKSALRQWRHKKLGLSFIDFFDIQLGCEPDCDIEKAMPIKCEAVKSDPLTIILSLTVPIHHHEWKLVIADPFKLITQANNNTCEIKYHGPENLFVSTLKEQCVHIAENINPLDTILAPLNQECMERKDHNEYFKINEEKCFPTSDLIPSKYVQIKYNEDFTYIYCPSSNITVMGVTESCPFYPFKILNTMNFTINGNLYTHQTMQVSQFQAMQTHFTDDVNWFVHPEIDFDSLKVPDFGEYKEVTLPPFVPGPGIDVFGDWSLWSIVNGNIIFIATVAIMLLVIIKCCCKKKVKETNSSINLNVKTNENLNNTKPNNTNKTETKTEKPI